MPVKNALMRCANDGQCHHQSYCAEKLRCQAAASNHPAGLIREGWAPNAVLFSVVGKVGESRIGWESHCCSWTCWSSKACAGYGQSRPLARAELLATRAPPRWTLWPGCSGYGKEWRCVQGFFHPNLNKRLTILNQFILAIISHGRYQPESILVRVRTIMDWLMVISNQIGYQRSTAENGDVSTSSV